LKNCVSLTRERGTLAFNGAGVSELTGAANGMRGRDLQQITDLADAIDVLQQGLGNLLKMKAGYLAIEYS
jgi:hypothetical protein